MQWRDSELWPWHRILLCVCCLFLLQNAARIASLSLYLPPFIFFFLPSWSFGLPPPFLPPSPLHEASAALPSRAPPEASPGCAPIGRAQPHGLRVGCPPPLSTQRSGCSNGITPQPQWEKSAGPGQREGETASPQWTWLTYSNISFVSFKLVPSFLKLYFLHLWLC